MTSYLSTWTCASCGTEHDIVLNKIEAAFFDCIKYRKERPACKNCGSTEIGRESHSLPEIDSELLDIWINDEEAFFMCQDEELLIADVHSSFLIELFKRPNVSSRKNLALIEALMVRLTDGLFSGEEESQTISSFLLLNRNGWDGNPVIFPYLQDRVRNALKVL